ncbi:unnamed protein product [Clavelina lepadiformis]|uniref:Tyrosine-protein kinase receptor n=1 Tax=Clavelina lepadiformis TaxID=159417 RepID=A0ABP0G0C6_CLALP
MMQNLNFLRQIACLLLMVCVFSQYAKSREIQDYNWEETIANDTEMVSYDETDYSEFYKGPVCELLIVMGTTELFQHLQNCTIVNGFIKILLINDESNKDFRDISSFRFPNLRVITEYLLIYRVHGLTSLSHLFPNLVMIGGQELFYEKYSLVVFENPDLLELGFEKLRYIKKGSARIENNGNLCYLSTVDWLRLGQVHGNTDIGVPDIIKNGDDECINVCGTSVSDCMSEDATGAIRQHCWGIRACQAGICPQECKYACDLKESKNKCVCNEECLGGCFEKNEKNSSMEVCYACRNYYYKHTCVAKCPQDMLLFEGWQCISPIECSKKNWLQHEDRCVKDCPVGHSVPPPQKGSNDEIEKCEKCGDNCYRQCTLKVPYEVDTTESMEVFRGCTIIDGQLIISIAGGSGVVVVEKLEEAFGDVREIGSLVIRRATPLVSLSFFKNLRRITGSSLFVQNGIGYSIYVWDNQNLKYLWDLDSKNNRNFTITKGKAFFHFNPYLCPQIIDEVCKLTPEEEDNDDISETSNGDRALCNTDVITDVTATCPSPSVADISWSNPKFKDKRTLIGYQVYYRESKFTNISKHQGADACGRSSWTIQDVRQTEGNHTRFLLNKLNPFTQYAFYIVAYTTRNAMKGAASNVSYFTTPPDKPSEPVLDVATAVNSSAILVKWNPPQKPNGKIEYYIVSWKSKPEEAEQYYHACQGYSSGRQHFTDTATPTSDSSSSTKDNDDETGTCSCPVDYDKTKEQAVSYQTFEDYIINSLIPRTSYSDTAENEYYEESSLYGKAENRKKRSVVGRNATSPPNVSNMPYTDPASSPEVNNTAESTTLPEITQSSAKTAIVNGTNFTITGLVHFMKYFIEVSACNSVDCSQPLITFKRTRKLKDVDKIDSNIHAEIDNVDLITLHWKPPKNPNSIIISYIVSIVSTDGGQHDHCCSIPHSIDIDVDCKLPKLPPGKFSATILPVSVAGVGVRSDSISFQVDQKSSQLPTTTIIVIGIVATLLFALPILFLSYVIWKRYVKPKQPPIYASVNPEYSSVGVYEPDDYEVPAENVELIREIGHGHFGKVYEGLAKTVVKDQSETKIAVKTLHGNESLAKRVEFLKEASVMKAFNAHHVVRLLGVVSITEKPMVLMEYMEKGDLKTYLRSTRPDAEERRGDPPTLQQKLQMCGEIADGMAYLAETKYVHRDLAARNCLVHRDMTVKIGDFGLTRDVYETDYYRIESRGILPVRWMAPESLKDGVFDSRSDVWSYGIVLWEIATLAEQPYQGQQHDQVTRYVIDGGYMEQPRGCPKRLYDLMLMCWHYSPSMRPTFAEIVSSLVPDLNDQFREVSFYYESKENAEENTEGEAFLGEGFESGALSTADVNVRDLHNIHNSHGDNNNAYRHQNGGHQNEQTGNGSMMVNDNDNSVRYIPNALQTHRHPSSIC